MSYKHAPRDTKRQQPSKTEGPGIEQEVEKLHQESFMWALACCNWNRNDAEDVLQTTYLKVFDGRAHFGGQSSFKTWLFGVIRMTAKEERRKKAVRKFLFDRWTRETEALKAPADNVLQSGAHSADKTRLNTALAQLPSRQREVLELVFYHDMTIAEAAEAMGIGLGTARTHYERGKKELQDLLSSEGKR